MKDLSLIPYLEPGEGIFYLDIVPSTSSSDGPEHAWFPFTLLNDADPFMRLYEAQIVSGADRSVLPLFLLVPANRYHYTSDQLRPLNNLDLERFWQQTHNYLSTKNNLHNRFFPLKAGSNFSDRPATFLSLFFCTHRHCYFHPPCSSCGKTLELCRDDTLLASKGLPPYGTSLRRYLYCPECHERNSEVYAYDREETDPLIVKYRGELIRSWRNVVTGRTEARGFPCTDCPEQAACFGETTLSETRIVPFLFYPSPIFVFDAATLNASDFLAMVSGATVDDVASGLKENRQYGRMNRLLAWRRTHESMEGYLFSGKPEQFLEILYLKLAFLAEVSKMLLGSSEAPVPIDIFTAFDALWVNLPKQNGLLPCFWNFKTCLFTAGPCEADPEKRPKPHSSQAHYCLGLIWFVTFLRNKGQTIRSIKETLDSCLDQHVDFSTLNDSAFSAPEKNFWKPDRCQMVIPEPWKNLWTRSLALGQRLLQDVSLEYAAIFAKTFLEDIEDIRQEIKEKLFIKESMPLPARPDRELDSEIHRILFRISEKWQLGQKSPQVVQEPEEETLTQTVVISRTQEPPPEKQPKPTVEEEIQETVILKKDSPPPEPPSAHPPQSTQNTNGMPDDEDDLAETFILKPSGKKDLK